MQIEARTLDGVIEAFRHTKHLLLGLQWHPEFLLQNSINLLFMISLKMLKTLSKKISELSQISRKKAEALIKEQGIILNGKIEKRPYIIVVDNDKIEIQKRIVKKLI